MWFGENGEGMKPSESEEPENEADGARALFEALCRVQSAGPANDGPEALVKRLAHAIGEGAPGDEDDFPDFSAEPPDPPPERVGLDDRGETDRLQSGGDVRTETARLHASGDARDALVDGLLRAMGSYEGLLTRYQRDFDEAMARRVRGEAEGEGEVIRRLRAAQTLLLKYPVAAQAAFASLVREGRRFAETDEGRAWKRRLSGSPTLARARTLFEGMTGGVVSEDGSALPSAYVDAFLRALDRDLEALLADLGGAGAP